VRKVYVTLGIVAVAALFQAGCIAKNIEGLSTLSALGKDAEDQEAILRKESENFDKLKRALCSQLLRVQLSGAEIIHTYGAPIVVMSQPDTVRWIYQGHTGGVFSDPKIYLYFDENQLLKRWEIIRADCADVPQEAA